MPLVLCPPESPTNCQRDCSPHKSSSLTATCRGTTSQTEEPAKITRLPCDFGLERNSVTLSNCFENASRSSDARLSAADRPASFRKCRYLGAAPCKDASSGVVRTYAVSKGEGSRESDSNTLVERIGCL